MGFLSLLVVLSLLLSACAPAATPTPEVPKLRVGLVTDVGKVNDGTFNEFAYKGMMQAVEEFGLESAFIETLAPTDYEKNITQLASCSPMPPGYWLRTTLTLRSPGWTSSRRTP